ncbi:hypothetical protein [Ekhidna sp.]
MKNLIERSLLASFFIFLTFASTSQSIGNSAYNVFGIGTLEQTGLVPYEAMGYAALGSRPMDMVNLKNPAALNSIRGFTQIFDVGVTFSNLTQSANDDSFNSSFGGIHDLNYWFRASPRTALSLGIAKFSDASYDILDSQSGSNSSGRSDSRHIGEGGSSEVYLAGSYSIHKNFHLGLKTHFLFGSQDKDEVLSVSQPRTNLQIINEKSFVKALLEAGLQYEYQLGEAKSIVLGSTFRTGGSATVNQEELIISDSGITTDTLSSQDDSDVYIPQKLGLGLGVNIKSWNVNLDYEFENWGSNKSQDGYTYRDRFITSVGAQFIKDRFSEKLIERIAFRFGGGIHSNYVSIDNEDFISQYYTAGIGIPINRSAASLNLSYQFYSTGTTSSNLIRETASTLSFSVIIRDVWFRKRAYD